MVDGLERMLEIDLWLLRWCKVVVLSDARLAVLVPHLYEGVPLLQAAAAAGVPERTA